MNFVESIILIPIRYDLIKSALNERHIWGSLHRHNAPCVKTDVSFLQYDKETGL